MRCIQNKEVASSDKIKYSYIQGHDIIGHKLWSLVSEHGNYFPDLKRWLDEHFSKIEKSSVFAGQNQTYIFKEILNICRNYENKFSTNVNINKPLDILRQNISDYKRANFYKYLLQKTNEYENKLKITLPQNIKSRLVLMKNDVRRIHEKHYLDIYNNIIIELNKCILAVKKALVDQDIPKLAITLNDLDARKNSLENLIVRLRPTSTMAHELNEYLNNINELFITAKDFTREKEIFKKIDEARIFVKNLYDKALDFCTGKNLEVINFDLKRYNNIPEIVINVRKSNKQKETFKLEFASDTKEKRVYAQNLAKIWLEKINETTLIDLLNNVIQLVAQETDE